MPLSFRNVDASPEDDVATWPHEALVTTIERGLVPDWQPLFAEIRQQPWGRVARGVERHLAQREHDGVGVLFAEAIERARAAREASERAEVARRIADAADRSGLPRGRFAAVVGTSASRLSTYANGKVTPSAAMLVRIERAARQLASGVEPGHDRSSE